MVSPTPAMDRASCGRAFGSESWVLAVPSWTSEADMARPCQRLDSESVSEVCRWRKLRSACPALAVRPATAASRRVVVPAAAGSSPVAHPSKGPAQRALLRSRPSWSEADGDNAGTISAFHRGTIRRGCRYRRHAETQTRERCGRRVRQARELLRALGRPVRADEPGASGGCVSRARERASRAARRRSGYGSSWRPWRRYRSPLMPRSR
jgi:hypothetical protein